MDHDQQVVSPDNVDDFIRIGTRVRLPTARTQHSAARSAHCATNCFSCAPQLQPYQTSDAALTPIA